MKFPGMLRTCAVVLAAAGLAACGESTGPGTAQLTILLTDDPGDVIEAWVTIDQVILVPGENGEEENGGGLLVLTDEDWVGDLLTLQDPGEFDTLVQDAVVPAGFYEQLRFVISGACIVVETDVVDEFDVFATPGYVATADNLECDEPTGALQTPSFDQTGVKVILPGDGGMELDGVESLTADFDVSESFGQLAGESGMWVMHPVIIATETEAAAE